MRKRVLVVDDEKNIRRTLAMVLGAEGFDVIEADSAEAGLRALEESGADVVLLDLNLPGMDGLEMLRQVKRTDPDRAVIMISGQGTVQTAVEATRAGAFDFLEKPLARERVLVAVRNAASVGSLGRDVRDLRERERGRHAMIGDSEAVRRLREEIERAAPTNARVLILGESGTGKELIARALHEASARAAGPFVKVNCAAIPEELIESELFGAVKGAYTGADSSRDGKFAQADGGTIFLDEIGDMSARAQAKVLRALQEGEIERVGGSGVVKVDVRVIAATNKDLENEVRAGRFREDLWYRLNVVPIRVPPLRERSGDVARLARHFLERFRAENNRGPMRLTDEAVAALERSPWPGNVRELQNFVERLAIMARGAEIGPANLGLTSPAKVAEGTADDRAAGPAGPRGLSPGEIEAAGGLVEARRRFEAACIRECLEAAQGNVSHAARLLGIDRTNLHKKLASLEIEAAKEEEGR
ncbi:MAG: sigma-54-dependent transcriptional regulator [Candidatus Eiseniibacteriota bacterium]